jgi:leucyl-tRNA synthetase
MSEDFPDRNSLEGEMGNFRFNTAIASLMEFLNEFKKNLEFLRDDLKSYSLKRFAIMLSPLAPHLGEECWQLLGNKESIFLKSNWIPSDANALFQRSVTIAVQVNGKVRATIDIPLDSEQEAVKKLVFNEDKVIKHTADKTIAKEIYVKNKIYNIVVK